jgi:hypothetical protein
MAASNLVNPNMKWEKDYREDKSDNDRCEERPDDHVAKPSCDHCNDKKEDDSGSLLILHFCYIEFEQHKAKGGKKMIKSLKVESIIRILLGVPALILALTAMTPTSDYSQDNNFRLINIERRLDQLQQRIDFIERNQQNQSLSRTNESGASTAIVLELQRQHLGLAEQVITLQKRVLDLQKTVDQIRDGGQERKEKPKEEVKPKSTQRKP